MGRLTESNAGCWIDGTWGQYGAGRLVEIAVAYGWDDADAIGISSETEWDEVVMEIANDAENWMNANIAPEGFSFGWHDGEFFLWGETEWEETY